MKTDIESGWWLATVVFLVMCLLACDLLAAETGGPIVQPDCRVQANGARSFGLKVDLLGVAQMKRPTKTVYVEQAVALWRPAAGELVAANEAPGTVGDVNAAVKAEEKEVPKGMLEAAGDHLKANAGKYIAGAVVAVAGGAGWAIYDHNKADGGGAAAAPAQPSNYNPQNAPSVAVTAGSYSPVTINITITAMPPE